ncbi:tetraacyldisaccharide 4'-kinase [Acinetobacter nectaris]|uniref:tetraacyldisaccharide 4'-kinase n=1 Tax=Acinetobacter nectaris TaxID=1219382 RepID=UPI001F012218|nr:tetraacyldisaccharide 4'-kinase [Acinetobacter nectaris]MCF9045326.1 tetraacyldisaccharide 4'-kinase [Acinetobacter nectaris]
MSLAQKIQEAWNNQSKWLVFLRPLSCLYGYAFNHNKQRYLSGKKAIYVSPVPVMVIGNITVGGSGKTPLLITLVKYLRKKNINVGVISRGYGGKGPFPTIVQPTDTAQRVGDEPALIVSLTNVPMAVGANRQKSIELLLGKYPKLDLIISDDGLQHWALGRQLEWIVLDCKRGLGNEKLLPEGFLREPKKRLENSTVIQHFPIAMPNVELSMYLQVGKPYCLNESNTVFNAKQKFHVLVGIGYPERFYQSLEQCGISDLIKHAFADHYDYTVHDLKFDDSVPIITTEKDAVKIKSILNETSMIKKEIWVLPVEAVLSAACYTRLQQQLTQLNIQI